MVESEFSHGGRDRGGVCAGLGDGQGPFVLLVRGIETQISGCCGSKGVSDVWAGIEPGHFKHERAWAWEEQDGWGF